MVKHGDADCAADDVAAPTEAPTETHNVTVVIITSLEL